MPALDELCRSYLDLRWHHDPAAASAAGLTTHDTRLGAFDAEAVREHVAALRSVMGAIEQVEVDELQDEIDRTALLDDIRVAVFHLADERPHVRNPEFWLSHLFHAVHALLVREDDAAHRARAVLERLEAAPAFLDAGRATLDEPAAVFVDTALGMLGGGGELIARAVATLGDEVPDLRAPLTVAGEAALESLARFGAALRNEIVPSDDPHAYAIGEDAFNRRLHHQHALAAGAPELHRYGLHLVEEVEAEIAALAATIDPERHWRDVVEALRDEAAVDDPLAAYTEELARAREFVAEHRLVTIPDAALELRPTPPFMLPLIPFAAYDPQPVYRPDRPGRFYVTLPDPQQSDESRVRLLRKHCRYEIPATVVHEAYPGHHLQLSTAHGLASEVRRHLWTPVMVEGWALYSEELMAEAGFYRGPEERLFRLVNLLWRALRIVLDVGLHTRGMSPAEAASMLAERLPMDRASADAEVRRYCAWPTYQLSYAVGRRELLRLRDAHRARAGGQTDPQRFHDELLSYGGLPVTLARWGMGLD